VYRLLSGSPPAAIAPPAAGKHAVTGHHPTRNPAARTSQAAKAPSAAPAAPAQPLTPVRAAAFGPGGGDNPQLAHLMIGGHRAAGWHTDWYTSARFGNLYTGTGLLLDMGRPVTVTAAQISLGSARGASLQLRIGPAPALADLPPAAHVSGASGECGCGSPGCQPIRPAPSRPASTTSASKATRDNGPSLLTGISRWRTAEATGPLPAATACERPRPLARLDPLSCPSRHPAGIGSPGQNPQD
jgi:hypothetical protein